MKVSPPRLARPFDPPNFRIALFVLLGFLAACSSKTKEQTTLSDDKIARIMADMNIADAATTGIAGYTKDSLMHHYFNQVFEIHGVSLESYEKDLRIVAQDLERMDRIVKKAEELLTEKSPESAPKPPK